MRDRTRPSPRRAAMATAATLVLGCSPGTGLPTPPSDLFQAVLDVSSPTVTVDHAGSDAVCSFRVHAWNQTSMALKITSATVRFVTGPGSVVSCRFTPPFGREDGVLLDHHSVTFALSPCATPSVPRTGTPFGLDVEYMDARGNFWNALGTGSFGWPFDR